MPSGLCNAPATFQGLMETVLAGLAQEKCIVYLNNVLVIGGSFEEHMKNLCEVFGQLREFGPCLKPSKCHLAKCQATYLGYNVSVNGVSADPSKVEAVRDFPPPKDASAMRFFLGLTRFVPRFSKIAEPLFSRQERMSHFNGMTDVFQELKA